MTFLHAIILGIIEGITEFLPISSTGHMVLASDLLKIAQTDFVKSFEIIIQLGAILAVVVLYTKKLLIEKKAISKIISAFIPTAIVGYVLYKFIKQYLIGNDVVVLWSLLIGGIVIILFELFYDKPEREKQSTKSMSDISYSQAIAVGLAQSVAVIPGVSRSAATIIGGQLAGISKKTIVEFSFILAVPTMVAATALDIFKNPISIGSGEMVPLMLGFVSAFIVALVSIKWLISFVQKHSLVWFGVYRVVVSLAFFAYFFWILK